MRACVHTHVVVIYFAGKDLKIYLYNDGGKNPEKERVVEERNGMKKLRFELMTGLSSSVYRIESWRGENFGALNLMLCQLSFLQKFAYL